MKQLSQYEIGETTCFASQADQRFGYYLYVPSHFTLQGAHEYPLLVVVHGTARTAEAYRRLFAGFAEHHRCIVMAPLFPVGIIEPGEVNNYKFIKFHDIRYDRVLLSMVDEVAARYGIDAGRMLLHGFSGGGHFVHRFFYLHPRRLLAVSIGAPGMVTLLDSNLDWHCGVRDFEQVFGTTIDLPAMREVAVQTVIGAADTQTDEITIEPTSRLWMPGVNDAGRTRLERIAALRASFERAGIGVRHDTVAGIGHEGYAILDPVKEFLAAVIRKQRAAGGM